MIQPEDVLSFNFYTYGQAFSGSDAGMRYRLIRRKAVKDEEGQVTVPEALMAWVWPEPFSFEATDKELITEQAFPFDEEGRLAAVAWLNEQRESRPWKSGFTMSGLKKLRPEAYS